MKYLSKIIDSLSRKPHIVILIAVIIAGSAIFLIERDYRSSLEKCADDINAEKQSLRTKEKKFIIETKLKEITLKEKSQTQSYLIDYQYCENLKKQNPETFKLQYGR
jgi:flagellar biosynthesis/type III secretory pathway M-ring protein FliF/YscJ